MTNRNDSPDFTLTQEQRILRDSTAEFFSKECPVEKVQEMISDGRPYDRSLWKKMADQGYLGLVMPESAGGMGYGPLELAIVSEEMGSACLPGPGLANLWAGCAIARAAAGTRRDHLLARMATGEIVATMPYRRRSDDGFPKVALGRSERDGEVLRFSGGPFHVLDGEGADCALLTARNSEGKTLLAPIPLSTEGIVLEIEPTLDHMRPSHLLTCNDVIVSESELLEATGSADADFEYATSLAFLAASAERIGAMEWILKASIASLKKREQIGMSVGAFGDISPRCTDLLSAVDIGRAALYAAAEAIQKSPADPEAVMSQPGRLCSEASGALRDLLLQRQEGMELTLEHDIHMFRSIPPFYSSIV